MKTWEWDVNRRGRFEEFWPSYRILGTRIFLEKTDQNDESNLRILFITTFTDGTLEYSGRESEVLDVPD